MSVADSTDYAWVERTMTLDAIDPAVKATDDNPGWRLLGVGVGSSGQTTLTYGWPWPISAGSDAQPRRLRRCVEAWPECHDGGYDPRCCRFPKSCSCYPYDDVAYDEADLEPAARIDGSDDA